MKKFGLILIVVLCIIILGNFVSRFIKNSRAYDIDVENIEDSRFTKLETALKNSKYFKDSTITFNKEKSLATIDNEYDVSLKNGAYLMMIKDLKKEADYCKIADAIEQSLGHPQDASLETCKETLNGTIGLGGISAEIFDNYKVLSVNAQEPAKLYKVENSHSKDELISTEEIDYDISIDDFVMTTITSKFNKDSNTYSVCGNIFNNKLKEGLFTLKIYDEQKEELLEKPLIYSNDTNKYKPFCVEFPLEIDKVKYYSIGD